VIKPREGEVNPYLLKKLDARIATQKRIMERTKPIWNRQGAIPGPLATGRSGYSMGKKLDAQNDRMSRAFSEYQTAEKEFNNLTKRRKDFITGKVNYNGQPKAHKTGDYAQSQFDKIEIGDKIDIGGNVPLKVIKKNKSTVVTEGGSKWNVREIEELIKSESIRENL